MYYLFEDKAIYCNTDYIISFASAGQRPLPRYQAKENALKKKLAKVEQQHWALQMTDDWNDKANF